MSDLVLIGLIGPVEGKEAEFREWYLDNHVEDSANDPIFRRGTTYELVLDRGVKAPGPQFITVYEVSESDAQIAHERHAAYQADPSAWHKRQPDPGAMQIAGAGWYRLVRRFENAAAAAAADGDA